MFQCELFPKSKIAIKYVLQTVVSLYIIEINQQIPNMQLHSKTDHICHDFPVFCGSKYSPLTHLQAPHVKSGQHVCKLASKFAPKEAV